MRILRPYGIILMKTVFLNGVFPLSIRHCGLFNINKGNCFMADFGQGQIKRPNRNLHKLIIPFYALLCLIEIPLLIKWNGHITKIYLEGMLHAIIAFVFPFIITGMITFFLSKHKETSFLDLFVNRTSSILLILVSLVLSMWYIFMFNLNF